MGYTVYWNQSSYNKLKQQFLDDVKTACEKYVAETGDKLDMIIDTDVVKVNSHNEGCEDCLITNSGAMSQFCKTNRQPYTLIVKAILLIAKKYDYVYNLSCDDSDNDGDKYWDSAKEFVKNLNLLVFN